MQTIGGFVTILAKISLAVIFMNLSGCSSSGRIPIISSIGDLINLPIEIAKSTIGVQDIATKKANKKLASALQKNKKLEQSVEEMNQMIFYIEKQYKCLRIERKGNSVIIIPNPDCY